jgi:predicted lipoprotein with Yx(FWY)xxD motif
MKHARYLLVLDTYAHSKVNTLYSNGYDTIAAAKAAVIKLIEDDTITFALYGQPDHKIYCSMIAKRDVQNGEYQNIYRTDDGAAWSKYTTYAHPLKGYDKSLFQH